MDNTPEINLLKGRKRLLKQKHLVIAKIQFIATLVLLVFVVLVVAVVLLKFMFNANLKRVEASIDKELLAITQLRSVEESYVLLVQKAQLVDDFVTSRGDMKAAVRQIRDSLPEAVLISSIEFADDNQISVSLVTADVYALIEYLNLIQTQVKDGSFNQISLDGLGRSSDGTWTTTGVYTLGEGL
jgi:hypothetical protein